MICLHCDDPALPGSRYCGSCLSREPPCAVLDCEQDSTKLRRLCGEHLRAYLASGPLPMAEWLKKIKEEKEKKARAR